MKFDRENILVLTGPTGSGKTDLALEWVKNYPELEIVSVDSALVYRGMDIGTAKPDAETLLAIPHHLINIKDPSESYSVAEFCRDCQQVVGDIFSRGKTPLLVGGTMMYLNALRQGLAEIPPVKNEVRHYWAEALKINGIESLYAELQKKDLISAKRLKPTDTQRILRALEVVESTGKPLHSYWGGNQKVLNNPLTFLGISIEDRAVLHGRIAFRTKKMLEKGLIEEVGALYQRGDLHPNLPSIRSVGYRQVWDYFLGNIPFDKVEENITISTRQLAKRQLTWMRSWPDIHWFFIEKTAADFCEKFLK